VVLRCEFDIGHIGRPHSYEPQQAPRAEQAACVHCKRVIEPLTRHTPNWIDSYGPFAHMCPASPSYKHEPFPAPQAPEPPFVPSPISEIKQEPKPLTGDELWGQPEGQEAECEMCGGTGEISAVEHGDVPCPTCASREIRQALASAQAAIAELVTALTRSDSYLSLLRHRAERDISWNDLGLRVSEVDEVIGQSRTALTRAKELHRG
jgi:hypothetical protein